MNAIKDSMDGNGGNTGRVRAVIYARTNRPDSALSIQDQCESLREYAARHDMEVAGVYADVNKSGSDLNGLDEMKRLLADVTSLDRNFDVILVYDWTRWGRFLDAREVYHQYLCRRAGVELCICKGPSPSGDSPVRDITQCVRRIVAKACGMTRRPSKRGKRCVRYVPGRNRYRRRQQWK